MKRIFTTLLNCFNYLRRLIVCVIIGGILGFSGIPTYHCLLRLQQPVILKAPDAFTEVVHNPASQLGVLDFLATELEWKIWLQTIESAYNAIIIWNGPGGYVMIEREVVDKIKELEKDHNLVFIVTQYAASADAMALCEFKHVQIEDGAILIFHDIETADHKQEQADFSSCVKKGYLTELDVQMIHSMHEVWVRWVNGVREVKYKLDCRFGLCTGK